jgi:uncharacterized protein YkwD
MQFQMQFHRVSTALLWAVVGCSAQLAEAPPSPAPVSAATPRAPVNDGSYGATAAGELFLRLLNQTRAERGLPALERNRRLDALAREWSGGMARANGLSHRGDLAVAAAAIEPRALAVAENVGFGGRGADYVELMHRAFVRSPGHYANMVGEFTRVGVGVVEAGTRQWVTVNFLLVAP